MPELPMYPLPPFTHETAHAKVKAAQQKWNTCNPTLVVPSYTPDSEWRNRAEIFRGRDQITKFLQRKWLKERNYRLRKEMFCFEGNKM